jgi:hypothetical protein
MKRLAPGGPGCCPQSCRRGRGRPRAGPPGSDGPPPAPNHRRDACMGSNASGSQGSGDAAPMGTVGATRPRAKRRELHRNAPVCERPGPPSLGRRVAQTGARRPALRHSPQFQAESCSRSCSSSPAHALGRRRLREDWRWRGALPRGPASEPRWCRPGGPPGARPDGAVVGVQGVHRPARGRGPGQRDARARRDRSPHPARPRRRPAPPRRGRALPPSTAPPVAPSSPSSTSMPWPARWGSARW